MFLLGLFEQLYDNEAFLILFNGKTLVIILTILFPELNYVVGSLHIFCAIRFGGCLLLVFFFACCSMLSFPVFSLVILAAVECSIATTTDKLGIFSTDLAFFHSHAVFPLGSHLVVNII